MFDTFGQVVGFEFKRNDLKSFNKIIIYYNSNSNEKLTLKSIYQINQIGDIIKSESYDSGRLTRWTKYEYYEDGRIKYEENHNEVFSYGENQKKHIGKVRDDVFHKKLYKYKEDQLVEVTYVDVFEEYETYSYLEIFEYDNKGQLVKETSINSFVGLTGEFQSNSTVLDSLYYKGEISKSIKINQYLYDSIVTTIFDESNKIQGYKLTKLNPFKKPLLVVDTDSLGNKIKSISMTYDKSGNLKEQRIKIIDIDKIDYDLAAGDSYQIAYNEKGLPITQLTIDKGKVISKWTLTYE